MLSRPRFLCDMLVDTSCQDKDDLADAATPAATLATAPACRKLPLLVFDAARVWDMPYKATLVMCALSQAPVQLPAAPVCGVSGCAAQLCSAPSATKLRRQTPLPVCEMHRKRWARRVGSRSSGVSVLWTPLELAEDPARSCTWRPQCTKSSGYAMTLRFLDHSVLARSNDVRYLCSLPDCEPVSWMTWPQSSPASPSPVAICLESTVPLRSAKVALSFRKHLLQRVCDAHEMLHNLILFRCSVCKERFPTFHPLCEPPFDLQSAAHCRIAVYSWDQDQPPLGKTMAPIATGCCHRCSDSIRKVSRDPLLQGVAVFSAENNMDFLDGLCDNNAASLSHIPPLLGKDDGRLRNEYLYLFQHATVVESMLVSLSHMQVDVCYLRGHKGQKSGVTSFRKNIISFPQDVHELRQLQTFWTALECGDIVNVFLDKGPSRRARVCEIRGQEVLVRTSDTEKPCWVSRDCVHQRLLLPWKPTDLRQQLIIFRRRDAQRDSYVDDLRVRRNLVRRLLLLLTLPGTWRTNRGEEPLHLYYSACEWLPESQIESLLPEDAVPEDLHMQLFDEVEQPDSVDVGVFVAWLREGRYDCPVAQRCCVSGPKHCQPLTTTRLRTSFTRCSVKHNLTQTPTLSRLPGSPRLCCSTAPSLSH